MEKMIRNITLVLNLLVSFAAEAATIIVEKNSPVVQGEYLKENVGIETLGGVLTPLLRSGCKLPCELSQIFSTAEDNQNQIIIVLVRGSQSLAKDGVNLGKYQITGISPLPRGVPQIQVIFKASEGNIWLIANDKDSNSDIKLERINDL